MTSHYPGTPGCTIKKHSTEESFVVGDHNEKFWNKKYQKEQFNQLFKSKGHEPFHVYPQTKEVLRKLQFY